MPGIDDAGWEYLRRPAVRIGLRITGSPAAVRRITARRSFPPSFCGRATSRRLPASPQRPRLLDARRSASSRPATTLFCRGLAPGVRLAPAPSPIVSRTAAARSWPCFAARRPPPSDLRPGLRATALRRRLAARPRPHPSGHSCANRLRPVVARPVERRPCRGCGRVTSYGGDPVAVLERAPGHGLVHPATAISDLPAALRWLRGSRGGEVGE